MKRLLLVLLLPVFLLNSCKKDKKSNPSPEQLPVISMITPSLVTDGSIVTITGRNFGTSAVKISVFFNGAAATVELVSETEIRTVVPVTTSGEIKLVIGGKTVNGPSFTYTDQGKVTDVIPATGHAGTLVRIIGTNFGATGPVTVSFNGKSAEIKSIKPTEIFAVVPVTSSGKIVVKSGDLAIQGPGFTYIDAATITGILPSSGTSGTVVTISGTNFGTSTTGVQVLFNDRSGAIQSLTPTEIKVVVPATTTGNVKLSINDQVTNGPTFTYTSPLTSPYAGGNVQLTSQSEVDAFVGQNKGKLLQITGIFSVIGNDISSLSGLSNITSVSNGLTVSGTQISEVGFLNNIIAVGGGVTLQNLAATTIAMDKLSGATGLIRVSACKNLRTLSCKSLATIAGSTYMGGLTITGCEQLSDLDLSALSSVTYRISLTGTALQDLHGFRSLQSAGALTLSSNPSLKSLHGLENLNGLTMTALTNGIMGGATINGLYINGNAQLSSLDGLQGLTTAPIARLTQNAMMNDLCPVRSLLVKLSTLPAYIYRTQDQIGRPRTVTVPALALTANGSIKTTDDALTHLALCR